MRFPTAVARDPAIAAWMHDHPGELGAIARRWFEVMRACGDDVRELVHDGAPTACVGDAAFGYVNAFTAHVNVGFFRGADLDDPRGLLLGTGKFMRHVKLRPEQDVDAAALTRLIETAYEDIKARMTADDWRAHTLEQVRRMIHAADADIVEERKWKKPSNPLGVPVWSHHGIVCTGETYKDVVKLTFARGAALKDPRRLFNASLEGNARRAIDIREGEKLDAAAFKALIKAAVAENVRAASKTKKASR